MKQILRQLLLCCFALCVIDIHAQKVHTFEFQTNIGTAEGSKPDIGLQYSILKDIESNVYLGFGVGLNENTSFDFAPTMPLFGRAEFLFSNNGTVKPFIDFDLGYSINFEDFERGVLFIDPVVGIGFNNYRFGVGYWGGTSFCKGSEWSNAIGIRLGYSMKRSKSKKIDWKNTGIYKFLKKTTFGIEGSFGKCFDSPKSQMYTGYESDIESITTWTAGFHWMYNIDSHWSAGIGFNFGYISYKVVDNDSNYHDSQDEKLELPEVFLRGEYTFDEIASDLNPYACLDLGIGNGALFGAQAGVKYKDTYRLGISFMRRNKTIDTLGTDGSVASNGLELHLGFDF